MVAVGDAFKCKVAPYHVYTVITAPDEDGRAVIVNLTDRDNFADHSCVLQREDYPAYITKPTIAHYQKADVGDVAMLETDDFEPMPSLPTATIRKMQEGALQSRYVKHRVQDIVRNELDSTDI